MTQLCNNDTNDLLLGMEAEYFCGSDFALLPVNIYCL